ncbi:MAG: hypothetical protein H7A00_00950 [Hahellaceae bacterium]|nr:hypothetical protein [Hahellaceae bacterium]
MPYDIITAVAAIQKVFTDIIAAAKHHSAGIFRGVLSFKVNASACASRCDTA